MFDNITKAEIASRWAGLPGVTLPDNLNDAIAVYEALQWADTRPATFDITAVTPENAEAKLREFAAELAIAGDGRPGSVSTIRQAQQVAKDSAARIVVQQSLVAVPAIIEQLTPEFDREAKAYVEAVNQLPEPVTAEVLVSGGAEAVGLYGEAQQAATHLNRISAWFGEVAMVSGVLEKNMEIVLRVVRPENVAQLVHLDAARHLRTDPVFEALDPVLYTAARQGVPFAINTPREAAELRQQFS
ncbi:hypothetical protein MMUR_47800 [Mycolicibacterium murale]|uniref:Uncharacterized protein n=1 Tax=Mycolicibacterium murale TaxID=182220 RepID=A0A7I9WSC6_9MYCO|nr:hypothetical protein [Mycolicibacterium murale]MCV7186404.1 hypothetical protein [Mycolicibacterium murale]GFG60644.1 hypothetical protein MMUR_47800 [Mycolicibacterium murale]